MKLIDLFEQQVVIEGDVVIPRRKTTLVGYKHKGKPIAGAKVVGYFDCYNTKIKSLEGGPSWVGDYFSCSYTKITSLEGGPSYVSGNFYCYDIQHLTSLHNIHKQIKHIGHTLSLSNTIKSHILGVMFIKGLEKIEFYNGNTEQKQVLLLSINIFLVIEIYT